MFLSLKGQIITNNSYVYVDDIGRGDDALLCHTNKTDCCIYPPNRAGEWYYPNGTQVGILGYYYFDEFYRNRGIQVVRLNRGHYRQGIFTAKGLFRCEVPDSDNNWQFIFINIGM